MNVLTVVFDKAEQKIDSVIAAAVNELHALGHVVKEVRVMTDTGEAKVPINTVPGVVPPDAVAPVAAPPVAPPTDPETAAVEATEPAADGDETPVQVNAGDGIPIDTPPVPEPLSPMKQREEALLAELAAVRQVEEAETPATETPAALTIDQQREALLLQLEELDKEEAAVDPTNSAGATGTPVTA